MNLTDFSTQSFSTKPGTNPFQVNIYEITQKMLTSLHGSGMISILSIGTFTLFAFIAILGSSISNQLYRPRNGI